MKWKGDRVWCGIVVLEVWYPIPHSIEIRSVLVFNTTPVLYILPFLTHGWPFMSQ